VWQGGRRNGWRGARGLLPRAHPGADSDSGQTATTAPAERSGRVTYREPRRTEAFGPGARSLLVMTTIEDPRIGGGWRRARWVGPFFAVLAILLLPWIVVLAARLPAHHASAHWDITWVGFDAVLSLLLISVAFAAWRRSPWLEGASTAAAAVLFADAW